MTSTCLSSIHPYTYDPLGNNDNAMLVLLLAQPYQNSNLKNEVVKAQLKINPK